MKLFDLMRHLKALGVVTSKADEVTGGSNFFGGVSTLKLGPGITDLTAGGGGGGGGTAAWPTLLGEVGVINAQYPPGDVRRYGVLPDGVDCIGLVFNGTTAVTAPLGTFTAAMVGCVICSPLVTGSLAITPPTILSVAGDGSSAVLSAAASSSGTGNARIGTWWERDQSAKLTAVKTNAVNPAIVVSWPAGFYCTGMNFSGSTGSGAKMYFEPGCEFSGLLHFIADAGFPGTGSPLSNLIMSGSITTYDRYGGVGLQNCDMSRLDAILKSDPTKHLNGVAGRGVHVGVEMINSRFGNFTVEDCPLLGSAANTDGAFILDTSSSHDCIFGDIWVKDSAGHGVLIFGAGHKIKSIRVDGWGYGTLDRQISETSSLAQCQELCAVWLNRCPAIEVERVSISQVSGSRPNALYDFKITQTSNAAYMPPSFRAPKIGTLHANAIQYRGISISDRANPTLLAELVIETLDVSPMVGTIIATGYQFVHVNAGSDFVTYGRNRLHIDRLLVRNIGTQINDCLLVAAGTECDINLIDTERGNVGHAGQIAKILGSGRIGRIRHKHAGGSGSPTSIIVGPANDGPVAIGPITAQAVSPSITLLDLTSATDFDVGPVNSVGYRGNGVIKLIAATKGKIKLGKIYGLAGNPGGWGMRWQSCVGVSVEGGTLTYFAIGITGQTIHGNTFCSATQLTSTGNTAQTDLPSGQVLVDATCTAVTL